MFCLLGSIGFAPQAEAGFFDFVGDLFGSGGSSTPPLVMNGGILPGPTNAGEGQTYIRDHFLPSLANFALLFLLAIAVVVLIVAGLIFIYSSGDSETVNKARDTIVWTSIGIVVGICSFALVKIVIGLDFGA